jgi:hypothetical protein
MANGVRSAGKDRLLIEEIGLLHPMLDSAIPQKDSIANAFDWESLPRTIEQKYGDGVGDIRRLYEELLPIVDGAKLVAAE